MNLTDEDFRHSWRCERCSAGDNATRYHNTWDVSVAGERGYDDMPELGEDCYDTQHDVELCDRCAKRSDITAWLLAYALRVELASRHASGEPGTVEETSLAALLEGSAFGRGAGGS